MAEVHLTILSIEELSKKSELNAEEVSLHYMIWAIPIPGIVIQYPFPRTSKSNKSVISPNC